jgi:glycosyltransferase involved in cell wall biosynthesis
MRVALVHNFHTGETPSGENEVVEAEAAALVRAGVDVRLAAVHNDEMARQPLHSLRAAATVASGVGLSPRRLLGDFEPDIIHVHSLFPYFGRRWLERPGAPVVATVHSYRSVCANGYLYRDGHVCTLCADGKRWSGVRYGCYRSSRLATLPLAWAARRGPGRDPLLATAERVLALSERARSVLVGAGVPADKVTVDWHFLPDACVPARGTRPDRDDAWLFVGRLTSEKGIDRLAAAWPADVRLRVIGEGPLRPAIERAAAGKRIEMLGAMPRAEVLSIMERSFGLVFPSLWYETFGLVYLEALAAGLPTLAFRPNVVADAVGRDGTGLIAPWDGLVPALAEATATFAALRDRCRTRFCERYDEAAFVTRRIKLYEELAA